MPLPKGEQRVTFGPLPSLPWYDWKAWTRWGSDVKTEDIWRLCGPTVIKHMGTLPLWKVFCVVYYEGLVHGHQATLSLHSEAQSEVKTRSEWSDCGES